MPVAWIALGSNLNDPAAMLDRALRALRAEPHVRLLQVSRYYDPPPSAVRRGNRAS